MRLRCPPPPVPYRDRDRRGGMDTGIHGQGWRGYRAARLPPSSLYLPGWVVDSRFCYQKLMRCRAVRDDVQFATGAVHV